MKPTILEHLNWRWTDDTIYRNILNTGSHKSEVFQDFLNFLPIWHALYICTIYGRTDSFWICLEIDFLTLEMKVLTIFFLSDRTLSIVCCFKFFNFFSKTSEHFNQTYHRLSFGKRTSNLSKREDPSPSKDMIAICRKWIGN